MTTIKITIFYKNTPPKKTWDMITNIEKYPQYVKFVKKVKLYGTGIGSQWDDITTILWLPLKMHHTVNSFLENKEYGFIVHLPIGGYMEQKYTFSQKDQGTSIQALVTYDFENKFFNATIGSILKGRLENMLISTFRKTGAEIL